MSDEQQPPELREDSAFRTSLDHTTSFLLSRSALLASPSHPSIPSPTSLARALLALPPSLPARGWGTERAVRFLIDDVSPGLWTGHAGGRNFGFVSGGVGRAAQLADVLVGSFDENVQVTQPNVSISTALEDLTTLLVLDLLRIPRDTFAGRTVTTGATASNIMGFACARDALLHRIIASHPDPWLASIYSPAEHGFVAFHGFTRGPPITVLSVKPHASILKAAALTGIGRANVLVSARKRSEAAGGEEVGEAGDDTRYGLAFDLERVEKEVQRAKTDRRGIIVAVALGEVNTGAMTPDIPELASLCKQYDAWLHIDAAFGGFGALLPHLAHLSDEMALADSLTLDAHKWLQAPYDTALFYTRDGADLARTFGPGLGGGPSYLSSSTGGPAPLPDGLDLSAEDAERWTETSAWAHAIPSPLFRGIENSRRFRALPLFAGLMEAGAEGMADIVQRNCRFASNLAVWLQDTSPGGGGEHYELMNRSTTSTSYEVPLNIVLFRARSTERYSSHTALVGAINATRRIYVSGTVWDGQGAVRVAVSNWRTGAAEGDEDDDLKVVKEVLLHVMR